MKKLSLVFIFTAIIFSAFSQVKQDSIPAVIDTIPLRIKNLNPYFTIQVDSALRYQLMINKDVSKYYFFLKNSPVGIKINKDNGLLNIKVDKSYFLSGRLKYDYDYKVNLSVQNLDNPLDRVDTSFTILFYSTEIIPSKVKPTVTSSLIIEEGDTISFKIQCDNGSFPIEDITYISNYPIKSSTPVTKCGDDFTWYAPFDFVKPGDKDKQRKINLFFIGTNKFHTSDTARIEITVKENINYPQQVMEFQNLQKDTRSYIIQLKSSFRIVDRKIKKTKGTRTGFDLASASTALGGTVFSSLPGNGEQTTGKILPSVGVALVPVKEATAPNSSYEQNTATLIRSSIKRLEYLLTENTLVGDRDPDIITKTNKIKDELKQTQIQLIDIPIAEAKPDEKEVDAYFNNPKVNQKYRMKKK
ncbi:MAG: hypothetical protein ABI091_11850 [Ferruginibacter sp.]